MANINKQAYIAGTHNSNIEVLDIAGIPVEQLTFKAASAIKAGAAVKLDTNGKFEEGDATTSTKANVFGIAIRTTAAGSGCTAVKRGILAGFDLSGLAYGANVYLSDTTGRLADAAGTVSKVVGRVVPVWGQLPGAAPLKALYVEL